MPVVIQERFPRVFRRASLIILFQSLWDKS